MIGFYRTLLDFVDAARSKDGLTEDQLRFEHALSILVTLRHIFRPYRPFRIWLKVCAFYIKMDFRRSGRPKDFEG